MQQLWKTLLLIPYVDFFIFLLKHKFYYDNLPAFLLFLLHPTNKLKINFQKFKKKPKTVLTYIACKILTVKPNYGMICGEIKS